MNLGRKYKAFLSLCLVFVLSVLASIASAQIDCCDETNDYNGNPPSPPGYFLCLSKTVPYPCMPACSAAFNCKWIHFRNQNWIASVGPPPTITEYCCYTKFKLRITKDSSSSTWAVCNVSNNWDCKGGDCDDAWTINDVTALPGTGITEGACNTWVGTFRDLEIFPTNGADCDGDCSIEALNHFLATLCGVKNIQISFDWKKQDNSTGTCGPFTYNDADIPFDACPDTESPCF